MDSKRRLFGWFGKSPKMARVGIAGIVLLGVILVFSLLIRPTRVLGNQNQNHGVPDSILFYAPVQVSTTLPAIGVAVGDFNNDAYDDIALATGQVNGIGQLNIYTQKLDGTLNAPQSYLAGNTVTSIAVGDVNGDNRDDIVLVNFLDHTVSVYLQQLNGTMSSQTTYPTDSLPGQVMIGDVNNDSLQDVVVLHANGKIGILAQDTSHTLSAIVTISTASEGGLLSSGDFNDDGRIDIAKTNNLDGAELAIYLQQPNGELSEATHYDLPDASIHGVASGDITGDGRTDFLAASSGLVYGISVMSQTDTGTLELDKLYDGIFLARPRIGDVNGDDRGDVIGRNLSPALQVMLQQDDSKLGEPDAYGDYSYPASGSQEELAIGDVNHDGFSDVVAVSSGLILYYHVNPANPVTVTPTPTYTLTPSATPTITDTPSPTPTFTSTPRFTTVIRENFDGSFPRLLWKVYDGWGKSTCQKVSGNYSAWSVRKDLLAKCTDIYPNNAFNWMIYGPFSLADAKKAVMTYQLWLNAELQKDVFFVGASVDGRRFYGKGYTGHSGGMANTNAELNVDDTVMPNLTFADVPNQENADATNVGWVKMKFDLKKVPTLGNLTGQRRVWIGFLWYSDAQNGLKGAAFVDDVLVTKVKKK